MKNLVKILAVLALVVPTMANAQNVETVPGPYLTTTPSSPYGLQNYRYSCDNTTPTSGHCWPLLQIYDGTNLGVVNPNGQASANNSAPVVLPAVQVTADLCTLLRKTTVPISTASGTTQLVAPVALNQVYICSIFINPTASNAVVSIIGGLGGSCATGTPLAMMGSTTLANGVTLVAGGGFTSGNGGATVMSTTTSGHGVCLEQSGTVQLSGYVTYIQSLL